MQINSSRPPLIPFPPPSTLLPRELQAQHQLFQQNHMRLQLSIQLPQIPQENQAAAPEPLLTPAPQAAAPEPKLIPIPQEPQEPLEQQETPAPQDNQELQVTPAPQAAGAEPLLTPAPQEPQEPLEPLATYEPLENQEEAP